MINDVNEYKMNKPKNWFGKDIKGEYIVVGPYQDRLYYLTTICNNKRYYICETNRGYQLLDEMWKVENILYSVIEEDTIKECVYKDDYCKEQLEEKELKIDALEERNRSLEVELFEEKYKNKLNDKEDLINKLSECELERDELVRDLKVAEEHIRHLNSQPKENNECNEDEWEKQLDLLVDQNYELDQKLKECQEDYKLYKKFCNDKAESIFDLVVKLDKQYGELQDKLTETNEIIIGLESENFDLEQELHNVKIQNAKLKQTLNLISKNPLHCGYYTNIYLD